MIETRQAIFSRLASILSCFLYVWNMLTHCSVGKTQQIRKSIENFILSVLQSNGVQMFRAIFYCWAGRQRPSAGFSFIPRDYLKEIDSFIGILIHLQNYTINEMIGNINVFIRDQTIVAEKVIHILNSTDHFCLF